MKRALVIEDNNDNMALITKLLNKAGYETLEAMTGLSGFQMAQDERPDFIILDIQLPDIDGTEVLARIRADEQIQAIPVIAMTSYAMAGDREKLLAAGCNGYIEKPINPMKVIEQLELILEG